MKDFFDRQDEAQRSTAWLVALYVLAVAGIVAALYVAVVLVAGVGTWWEPGLLLAVALGAGLVIGGGSAFKLAQLRGGGSVVAEQLGGRLLERSEAAGPGQQRLLNVVEEMAIAAGVPVPRVYVLPEPESINAFAAGHTLEDAVVGVTEGAVERLSRAELQGVVAHEFSHILHGDMRINLRLIGLLHGILLMGLIGRLLLYGGGPRRMGRSGTDDNRGRAAVIAMGLAVFAIGSIGVLCGRLIQSAISRQREFLADASAVQFTRNPEGLAGALKKIGGLVQGGRVPTAEAQEASHLFFAYPLSGNFFGSLFSTHPPLKERVRRLDPDFEGDLDAPAAPALRARSEEERRVASLRGAEGEGSESDGGESGGGDGHASRPAFSAKPGAGIRAEADRVAERAGTLDAAHMRHGHDVLEALPPALRRAAHEPLGAVALVYGLLLDPDPAMREGQLDTLRPQLEHGVLEETQRLFSHVRRLERHARLPLVDVATPALRELSGPQAAHVLANVDRLVEADSQLTLFEYALRVIVQRRLHAASPGRSRYRSLRQVHGAVEALLAALAQAGHRSDEETRAAFHAGLARFDEINAADARFHNLQTVAPATLDRALRQLQRARPPLQRQVIDACAHIVLHDQTVTTAEAELLRAVAVALGCPLPPFLPAAASSNAPRSGGESDGGGAAEREGEEASGTGRGARGTR